MSSIELNDVPSGYNLAKINENFQEIERVLNEEVLHRVNDGTLPNTLETDIDANSQHIYNLPKPATGGEPLRLKDLFGSPEELLQGPEIEHITAIEGQTVFNLATAYVPDSDSMYVFRNGILLQKTVDYVETGTQQVTLNEQANANDVISFVPVAVGGGAGGGDPATGINVGGGVGVFRSATSSQLSFKSLVAGSNVTLSGFDDTVRIDAVAASSTASNVGTGAGIYKQKTGDNFEFKTLAAGANVSVTPVGDTVVIEASLPAGTGEANTASNVGTGSGVFKDKAGVDLRFKSLKAGTNVTLVPGADDITIHATGGGGGSGGWPIINVMDYGADPSGATSSLAAFNSAATAAGGGLVYVPTGTYAIGSATNSASWWIAPNATISGLANTYSGQNDTSRLTGQVFNMESNKATPRLSGLRVGSSKHWLENDYWKYADGLATIAGVSDFSGIGIAGVSRTSDDPNATMGSIGVGGFSVNDQTVNPEPAWAMYLNHQRMANTGPSFGMEIDNVNFGNTYSLTPYSNVTAFGSVDAPSVNVWLSAGGGTDAIKGIGNNVSAAITLLPNPSSFYRGMVIRAGAIDPATNEIIASYNGGKIAWYDAQGGTERVSGYISSAGPVAGLDFYARDETTNNVTLGMRLDGSLDTFRPIADNILDLGMSVNRWRNIYSIANTVGVGVTLFDGGETGGTAGAGSIGRSNPLRTTSSQTPVKVGHGSSGSPVSANSPAVWQESWVNTDYTSLGDGSEFAQGVSGALFQTFKTGGTGGVNGVISMARANSNTAGDIIGLRGIADGKDRTSGPTTYCGIWAEVEGPGTNYSSGSYGIEINAFTNYSGSTLAQDPFTSSGGKVTGMLINNYQKAGTPGNHKNHFGIAITSITGTTRAKGYHTGLYIADSDSHSIRLFGGTRVGDGVVDVNFTHTTTGIEMQGRHGIGINFATACGTYSGTTLTRGHAIKMNDNKMNWGDYTSATWEDGDMWANWITGQPVLFFKRGGFNNEILAAQTVTTSGAYTGNRKIPVYINGTVYYIIASTTA